MSETYKTILPGNYVTHSNAYALPNDSFKANARVSGAPQDRCHQAVEGITPGWASVRKVGFCSVVPTPTGTFDFIVPSPDLRPDDKPRADIKGLWIPAGAYIARAGFRVVPAQLQPGASSSGPLGPLNDRSGISGVNGQVLVLSSAAPSGAPGAGSISGTKVTTDTGANGLVVAGGQVPVGFRMISSAFGNPQQITDAAGLTFRLYVMAPDLLSGGLISSVVIGGAKIVAEIQYVVATAVADLDDVHLGGAVYAGTTG
jgi:hypothetical protein